VASAVAVADSERAALGAALFVLDDARRSIDGLM
jgi:hypothetical protein